MARAPGPTATCRCGHGRAVHAHLRAGSDCGRCGPQTCPVYRRDTLWGKLARKVRFTAAARRSVLRES